MVEVSQVTMEELLQHEGWVQGLARSLVHDSAAAEDLVQETWLAALRRPPSNDRPLRPWLGRVVRNFASERRRRDSRRVVVDEIDPISTQLGGDAQSEAAEVRAQVVEALMQLRDPYRTTVMLRYYGGLEPQDIALRQGLPSATVRTRLRRGLLELRRRLESSWSASDHSLLQGLLFLAYDGAPPFLPPLGGGPSGGEGASSGAGVAASATGTGLRLAAGFAALAGGVTVAAWVVQPAATPITAAVLVDGLPDRRSDDAQLDLLAIGAGRTTPLTLDEELGTTIFEDPVGLVSRSEPSQEEISALAIESPEGAISGLVLEGFAPVADAEAVLVAGKRVRLPDGGGAWPDNTIRTRTNARGEFVFSDVEPGTYTLAVYAFGHVRQRILRQPSPSTPSKRSIWIFGSGALTGSIWDSDGHPRVGLQVRVQSLGGQEVSSFQTWDDTDAHGRFRLDDLPAGRFIVLTRSDLSLGENWFSDLRKTIEIDPGGRAHIDFGSSTPMTAFLGRVRNGSGEPPAEMGVLLVVELSTGIEHSFPCDAEGRSFGRLPPGLFGGVRWTPRGGRRQDLIALNDFEQTVEGGEVEFGISGARLWGSVAGKPRGRVFVQPALELTATGTPAASVERVRSTGLSADGTYAIDGLQPGSWRIWAVEPGVDGANIRQVEVRAGEAVVRFDLE